MLRTEREREGESKGEVKRKKARNRSPWYKESAGATESTWIWDADLAHRHSNLATTGNSVPPAWGKRLRDDF